jgi:hypothetical protein
MPLDSIEAYERLGEHLAVVDPIIERFCQRTGFERCTSGVGRYPKRRLELHSEMSWFIELGMDLNEHGQRYDVFYSAIPYSLGGGAWIDRNGWRYADRSVIAFSRMPFHQLSSRLEDGLISTWQLIRGFNLDHLLALPPIQLGGAT